MSKKPPLGNGKAKRESSKELKSNKTYDAKTAYDSARTGGTSYRESSDNIYLLGGTGSAKTKVG